MNTERDRFLAEAMGECWHDWDIIWSQPVEDGYDECVCLKCNASGRDCPKQSFSTWAGFGKLWEWAQKQEWCISFLTYISSDYGKIGMSFMSGIYVYSDIIHPDRFADAVYTFLKEREAHK